MNAMLNIVVRVDTTQANSAWKSQRAQLNGLQKAGAGLSRALNPDRLVSWGKNLQWTGRQLEFAFTLPLVLAGAAATKWQLDNERAMTEVKKVYGGLHTPMKVVEEETNALAKSFELLSSRFGVNQKEVIDVGAAWAQAGASGLALADDTKTTMETMILSGMDATESTQALISIMSVWNLSNKQNADGTSELTKQLGILNVVENETTVSYADLITVLEKAGGVARISGVDIQHLAAFTAAMVPAAGSAAQAGNGLKTMISRLQAPTKDTVDLLEKLGISVLSPDWLGKSATDKILTLAKHFDTLSDAQKTQMSSVIASRWQVNKFAVLMDDINDPMGNYQRALRASNDETLNSKQYLSELNQVLESNPRRWDIMVQSTKNALTSAIIPLIPAIFGVLRMFVQWAQAFSKLDPERQKFYLGLLVILAALGPVMRYLGTTAQLVGEVGKLLKWTGRIALKFSGYMIQALGLVLKGVGMTARGFATFFTWVGRGFVGLITKAWAWATNQMVSSTTAAAESAAAQSAAAGATADAWAASMSTVSGMFVTTGAVIETTAIESVAITSGAATATAGAATGALGSIAAAIVGFFGAPIWAIVAIVAAVIAAVVVLWKVGFYDFMFRMFGNVLKLFGRVGEGIWHVIKNIADSVLALPRAFLSAFQAVVRIVNKAVEVVRESLSYLNPFARHSPSLVDNVKAGVSTILSEYSRLRGIPQIISNAAAAHDRFLRATRGSRGALDNADRMEQREKITNYAPSAGPAVDDMYRSIDALKGSLQPLTIEISRQEQVIARWQAAYDKADAKVKQVQDTIDVLQYRFDVLDDVMSQAQDTLNELGNTDLPGMRAMGDQIFNNEMAQKRLRLEIMRLEDAGQSVEDLQDKMAKLQGEIELVQGTQNELRLAGAGSEILGVYDDQIDALRAQQDALHAQGDEVDNLKKQLEELQRTGERLDLENSINFDPQIRQIDQMINGLHEMPFDEIIRQVTEQRRIIDATQPAYDAAKKALEDQRTILRDLTFQRDQIGNQLDIEKDKADQLNDAYSAIEQQINDMESALSGFASQASAALDKLKEAQSLNEQLFDAGAGADFDTQSGTGGIESYGDLGDIEKWNDDMQAELDKALEGIGGFDMLKPFKEKWNAAWGWIKKNTSKIWQPISENFHQYVAAPIADAGGWIGRNFSLEGLKNVFNTSFGAIKGVWNGFTGAIKSGYDTYISPVFSSIADAVGNVVGPIFDFLADRVSNSWSIITTIFTASWNIIKPIFDAIWGFIGNFIIPIFQLFAAIVEIVFTIIGRVIAAVWEKVIKVIWDNIKNGINNLMFFFTILGGVVGFVWAIISGAIKIAWTIISGIWSAIVWVVKNVLAPTFTWLKDNVIQPVWNGIKSLISTAWDKIKPIFEAVKSVLEKTVGPAFDALKATVKLVFDGIKSIIKTVWNDVATIIETGVNSFIKMFNFLAQGVNTIGGALHIDVHVGEMEEIKIKKFARGGRMDASEVGAGFVTNGPRAIVGEGSRIHPEYVIPTDPRYRNRAIDLLTSAANTIMQHSGRGKVPDGGPAMLAWGGIIPTPGDIVDAAKNVVNEVKEGAIKAIYAPLSLLANAAIDKIPVSMVKQGAKGLKGHVDRWVEGADGEVNKAIQESVAITGQYANHPARGKVMNWITTAINNLGAAAAGYPHNTWAPGDFIVAMRESGGNPKAINLWDSNAAKGTPSKGLMQMIDPTFNRWKVPGHGDIWNPVDNVMSANRYIKATYGDIRNLQQANPNMPPRGYAMGGTIDAALARGGAVLNRKHGGVTLHVAEGNSDEEVQVRPLHKGDDRGRELHFHGNLVFPNVTNGSDAEDFVKSLESLGD